MLSRTYWIRLRPALLLFGSLRCFFPVQLHAKQRPPAAVSVGGRSTTVSLPDIRGTCGSVAECSTAAVKHKQIMYKLAHLLPSVKPATSTNDRLCRFVSKCWSRERGVMRLEVFAEDFLEAAELLRDYGVQEVFDLKRTSRNVRFTNLEQINELG